MTTRRPERFVTLLSVFLLLALAAGSLDLHSHPQGRGKTCTLCQAPHLRVSLTPIAGLSRPPASLEPALPGAAAYSVATVASSTSSRGPPSLSPAI